MSLSSNSLGISTVATFFNGWSISQEPNQNNEVEPSPISHLITDWKQTEGSFILRQIQEPSVAGRSANKPLHPPYFCWKMVLTRDSGSAINFHNNLDSSAIFISRKLGTPRPPACMGRHIRSHAMVWSLRRSTVAPQKKFQQIRSKPFRIGLRTAMLAWSTPGGPQGSI